MLICSTLPDDAASDGGGGNGTWISQKTFHSTGGRVTIGAGVEQSRHPHPLEFHEKDRIELEKEMGTMLNLCGLRSSQAPSKYHRSHDLFMDLHTGNRVKSENRQRQDIKR